MRTVSRFPATDGSPVPGPASVSAVPMLRGDWLTNTTGEQGWRVLAKLLLIKDKAALRRDFERFAQIPDLVRLIVAHEKVASGPEAKQAFLRAAQNL